MVGMVRFARKMEQVVVKNTFISVVDVDSEAQVVSSRPRSKTEPDEPFKSHSLEEEPVDTARLESHRGRLLSFDVPQTPWEGASSSEERQSFGLPQDEESELESDSERRQLETDSASSQENLRFSRQGASTSNAFGEMNFQVAMQPWMVMPQGCMIFPMQMLPCQVAGSGPSCQEEASSEVSESDDAAALLLQVKSTDRGAKLQGEWTTVMLRNLPNNYTRDMVLKLLDHEGFAGKYDFFYLPIDFKSKASLGYAFVNLVDAATALEFRATFEGYSEWFFPSKKQASVSWSEPHQGQNAHIQRYRNSPLMHSSVPDECKPMVFENGIRVAFPLATKAPRKPRRGQRAQGACLV